MSGLTLDVRVSRGAFALAVAAEVAPGETLGVIGPNGAGKTTLLRAVAGLEPIDAGRIALGGQVWDDPATGVFVEPRLRGCPVLFQDYRLFPHLTVLDNVAYPHRARGASRAAARDAARATLERAGLAAFAGRRPAQLSGGQAQRVAMARALTADPRAVLLDEPLAALDARTRQETRRHLKDALGAFPGPSLVITHDPVEAMTLADRLLVVEAGRVVQAGPPREVAARPVSDYVARLVGLNLLPGRLAADGGVDLAAGGRLWASVDEPLDPGAAVLVALSPASVAVHLDRPEGMSSRNIWPARIRGVEALGQRLRLDTDGAPPALVDLTPTAFAALGLDVGSDVWLSAKATELVAYAADLP